MGYDPVYGFQDINDDEIIGVKSTSIKFKENYKLFVGLCYFICVLFLTILGFLEENKIYYFTFLIFPAMHLFYQMTRLDRNDPKSCLIVFKSNNFFGFLVFLVLMATNIWILLSMSNKEIIKRLYDDYINRYLKKFF